jgi:hypothetical protein
MKRGGVPQAQAEGARRWADKMQLAKERVKSRTAEDRQCRNLPVAKTPKCPAPKQHNRQGCASTARQGQESEKEKAQELLCALHHQLGSKDTEREATVNGLAKSPSRDPEDEPERDKAHASEDDNEELKAAQTLSGLARMVEEQKLAVEKKERKNFTKETVDELKKWFANHLDHPYPDEEDKEELARKTSLSAAQVAPCCPLFTPRTLSLLLSDGKL